MNGTSRTDIDDRENDLIATGSVLALLQTSPSQSLTAIEAVTDAAGNFTNQIDICLSFMRSPYRITVERVTDGDEAG